MIQFQNVSKEYDKVTALKDISFSIEKAEMVFFTGRSGSGKTTLLKLIYCAEKPDQGSIHIGGWETERLSETSIPYLRRNIGIVFQDFRLLNSKTVFENIAISLRLRGLADREIKTRVFESLKLVNLRHKADSYPKYLSGGEQQRIVIARAIVPEPPVILADEPTGNLDPKTSEDIMNTFRDIHAKGTTIVIATHNRELYTNTGHRVFRLESGILTGEDRG